MAAKRQARPNLHNITHRLNVLHNTGTFNKKYKGFRNRSRNGTDNASLLTNLQAHEQRKYGRTTHTGKKKQDITS